VSDSTHHAYWCARVQTKKQSRKKCVFNTLGKVKVNEKEKSENKNSLFVGMFSTRVSCDTSRV